MITKSGRTVCAIIGRIRIFLFGLHAVNAAVIGVEFVVIDFIADNFAEQYKHGKSDHQIGKVDHRKNLIVADVSKNVDEKMSDHGFECKFVCFFVLNCLVKTLFFVFVYLKSETVPRCNLLLYLYLQIIDILKPSIFFTEFVKEFVSNCQNLDSLD